ncbi:MAG: hypothetical protein EPN25_09840 [Nitrospirae bacterium]|nr:MAG: hypothetical protein EPN25_09840 [Nitrospirota bacterium]
MGYTNVALKDKIMEMYPEVEKRGVAVSLDFSEEKNAFIVKFSKGGRELTTHLEKKDADDCMNNIKCVYLGMQIAEFIKNFEMIEKG